MKTSQALTKVLPLMIGYFALSVPSGLSLYWFTNNILSTLQQVFLQKMGGAKNPIGKLSDEILKEEQTLSSKTISDDILKEQTPPPKTVLETKTQTEEKSPSTGLRPGERFKQLKEEEARRKRQREEEKKNEAPTVDAASKMNGLEKQDDSSENGAQLAGSKTNQHATTSVDASNGTTSINGSVHASSKEHQDAPELTSENNWTINDSTGKDSEDVNQEAVEAHSRLGSVDQRSGEETS